VILFDANVLIYAENVDDARYPAIKKWIASVSAGPETIGLPWPVLWAFLRISTNNRIFPKPFTSAEAFRTVKGWLAAPGVVTVEPGPRHAEILERLISDAGSTGSRVSDAVLAALAIENGATLASTDRDFNRFAGLKWIDPLAQRTSV